MSNLIKTVKEKVNMADMKCAMAISSVMATILPGYCSDANTAMTNTINAIMNIIKFAGYIMLAIGVVQLVRCIMALTSGDQLQPGQLGKALGMIIAGVIACTIETVLEKLGINKPTSIF
jgi:hypothetical protein